MELLGVILPAFIDLINRRIKDTDARFWISVIICMLVGAGVNFIETGFVFESVKMGFTSISTSIMSVFGWAQISYKAAWENSQVRSTLGLNAKDPQV